MSAPRSIMPCWISKTKPPCSPARVAHRDARSVVVDMKAPSMPPRTPKQFGVQNCSRQHQPRTPRYTLVATVSLDSLTIAELIACSVVVYLLTCRLTASSYAGRLCARAAPPRPPQLSLRFRQTLALRSPPCNALAASAALACAIAASAAGAQSRQQLGTQDRGLGLCKPAQHGIVFDKERAGVEARAQSPPRASSGGSP